jgi:hypothetical protein
MANFITDSSYQGIYIEQNGGDLRTTDFVLNPTNADLNNISIIKGCTNPDATNYNPKATVDDGSCTFEKPTLSLVADSKISIWFRSAPGGWRVYINDVPTDIFTSANRTFDWQEFLTTKTFTIKNDNPAYNNRKGKDYRITTKAIKDSGTGIGKVYYLIEQKNQAGRWVTYQQILSDGALALLTIPFELSEPDDTVIDPPVESPNTNQFKVQIIGDVSETDIIKYRTYNGLEGFVNNSVLDLNLNRSTVIEGELPWISLERVGVDNTTHNITYTVTNPGATKSQSYTSDFKKILYAGVTEINVEANKIVNAPTVGVPRILLDINQLEHNYNSNVSLDIPYDSINTDRVIYTIGNIRREVSTNGVIKLKNSDFTNGLGQYTLILQPISDIQGSGELKRVVVNVVSKTYREGPDITHINFPYNIKGSDFKGYDEDFQISWQSVNTNYVELYVGKKDPNRALAKLGSSGALTLNVANVLSKSGLTYNETTDAISFELLMIPYNTEGDSTIIGKTEKIKIIFDKSEITLKRAQVIYDLNVSFRKELNPDIFKDQISRYLTHFAHFGDADNKLITTWGIDTETFSKYELNEETNQLIKVKDEKALVLKLYEPLPTAIQPNQSLWLSKIQSLTLFEQLTLTDDEVTDCINLEPNFSLDLGDEIGYQILDDLVASGSQTSTQLVEEFINKNELSTSKLNIQYQTGSDYAWNNFVKYSSAEERIENFYYKIKTLEFYESKLDSLETASLATTSSITVQNEQSRISGSITNLKKGFDAFEKYMYSESSSISYPGAGSILSGSTDSSAITWYNTAINSAQNFDKTNQDSLINNIPSHYTQDSNNGEYILFFNMIGNHFDVIWSYINGLKDSKKLMHTNEEGMINDLIYHMLESLGWDADMGVSSQVLWEYAFGKYKDGTTVSLMSGKERQQEIWRRILNNLPYLYKYKGTKRALHAAMACYGVPSSMLTILEFGGPKDPTDSGTTQFTFDDRTAALSFDGTASVLVPWQNDIDTGVKPETIEFRFNTQTKQQQTLLDGPTFDLVLVPGTGSQAAIEFFISGSGGTTQSGSTGYIPMFNDLYTNVAVTKTISGSDWIFDVYVKEAFNDRIRNQTTASILVPTSSIGWENPTGSIGELVVGSGLIGTMDEFRLWSAPLSESRVQSHTLLPDAIDGNHVSSSTEDLVFRLDFEYPKDRTADTGILNVAINQTYGNGYATASNFPSASTYPYQYETYERTVTATVPSTGIGVNNKIRFETHTLDNYLNYGTVSNATNLERADDSNKLGLFFSPIKEVNMDIVKSLGQFNIDNYIGNPADEYRDTYQDLETLRNYYFQRYDLNIYEYIQLVRYIDKSLFDTLKSLVPARAKVSSGLLIEPHLLERSKIKRTKPTGENIGQSTLIRVDENINVSTQRDNYETSITASDDISLDVTNPQWEGLIEDVNDTELFGEVPTYTSEIDTSDIVNLIGDVPTYIGTVSAEFSGSIQGEYFADAQQSIGLDPDSVAVAAFGIYAENGRTIRTSFDGKGNRIKERLKVFQITEEYTVKVPTNISVDPSLGTELVEETRTRTKITFTSISGSEPAVTGSITSVTPVDGYVGTHYRNTSDLTVGMENSFFKGSVQTDSSTIDGLPAVQTFTTNPNTLRVNEAGRGSGEPILFVD